MPATLPTGGVRNIRVKRVRRQASTQSPFDGSRQVYDWNDNQWIVTVEVKPYKEGDAGIDAWIQFFEDCDGLADTFSMDISRYVPGQSGLTAVTFRMLEPNKEWGMNKSRIFDFSFSALSE